MIIVSVLQNVSSSSLSSLSQGLTIGVLIDCFRRPSWEFLSVSSYMIPVAAIMFATKRFTTVAFGLFRCLLSLWVFCLPGMLGAPLNFSCPQISSKHLLRGLRPITVLQLQQFTPLPLCKKAKLDRILKKAGAGDQQTRGKLFHSASRPSATFDGTNGADVDPSRVAGCTAADLERLLVIQPSPGSKCAWRMNCGYDADRFPQILYHATMPSPAGNDPESENTLQQCRLCRPVYRIVSVLRRRYRSAQRHCKVWDRQPSFLRIIIGYECP
eukprot:scpid84239/ scgid33180/ 